MSWDRMGWNWEEGRGWVWEKVAGTDCGFEIG